MPRLLLISLLLSLCPPALAIYKCENGGKIAYSDTPCPDGTLIKAASGAPSADDSRQGQKQLAQQKAEAQRLEKERHQREAIEEKQQQQNARTLAARQKKCAASALRVQWAQDDARQAAGKAAPKATQKARRAAEKHELECGK